ncbi:hypothetical protein [Paenibacillus sp. Y412MC10]|uniref:hypothetical protein n=1 Tax=Geobacillus sp. (strain Y412MC10) TaxID=481743 RepID=UPI0016427CD8|nr:hypothetical protein [Paenibacillus sp. Y412MC10]
MSDMSPKVNILPRVIRLSETVYSAAITEKVMNITKGQTNMTYDPEAKNKRVPIGHWPEIYGKSRLLLKGGNKEMLGEFEKKWSGVG